MTERQLLDGGDSQPPGDLLDNGVASGDVHDQVAADQQLAGLTAGNHVPVRVSDTNLAVGVRPADAWRGRVIDALADFNVDAGRRVGRVGVWVRRPDMAPLADGTPCDDKIAAIGVKLRRWVSFHGVAINLDPDLSHYDGIVPCGLAGHGVTSLAALGLAVTAAEMDARLRATFLRHFPAPAA